MSFKIYDCSNSPERPEHRGGGGPITNDIMRYLKENCEDYAIEFTDKLSDASIVITNDVFTDEAVESGLCLVKRMCGPFWHSNFIHRNDKLNRAARQADKVIFITEYSKEQYIYLYGMNLKKYSVINHWVDPNVFFDNGSVKMKNFTLAASATNWNRKEKRLSEIIKFAKMYPSVDIMLIGTNEVDLPANIRSIGYINDPRDMCGILNLCHGFINLSYRDAATKTIPQAINCNLPVLYANSGGVIEMVGDYGTDIKDDVSLNIMDHIPELSAEEIAKGYEQFREDFDDIKELLSAFDKKHEFRVMLDRYFSEIVDTIPSNNKFKFDGETYLNKIEYMDKQ